MATTKLWHIQGRLKDLVDYVENPEKTVKPELQDFFNVFSYAQNPDKTADGQFVTAINCQKDIALLPKSQPCARTSGTARKSNSVPWKFRIRWIVLLKRSIPAGTERSMPICMKIDKIGNHWEKRGQ